VINNTVCLLSQPTLVGLSTYAVLGTDRCDAIASPELAGGPEITEKGTVIL